jgi:hypothetical protein
MSIDATVVFHNIMMKYNKDEIPNDVDSDAASAITDIDDPDRAPIPEERITLDQAITDGAAPDTRRNQLLKYVREFYVRPIYGSPVSTMFCGSPGDISVDDMSAIGDELFFSEDDE